jgi:hypothetical protein
MALNPATDPFAWWLNQIELHPPQDDDVAEVMDTVRGRFKDLGTDLIGLLPPGPDLTVALRALKEASQAAIGCIACNQDELP